MSNSNWTDPYSGWQNGSQFGSGPQGNGNYLNAPPPSSTPTPAQSSFLQEEDDSVANQWAQQYNGGNTAGYIGNFEGVGTANPGAGTQANAGVNALGAGSNANLGTDYGGWSGGAVAADEQYRALAAEALQRGGATINNPYALQDRTNQTNATSQLSSLVKSAPQAWKNAQGQNLSQAQYGAATNANLAATVAAMRSGRGVGAIQGLTPAQQSGTAAQLAALQQAGATQLSQNQALGGLQNAALGQVSQDTLARSTADQQAAIQQAQLTQQQNALNTATFNQFYNMGQTAQLADLNARQQVASLNLQQSEANAKANGDVMAGLIHTGEQVAPYLLMAAA